MALKLHSFAYKLSSVLAIKQEGKHPKHRLTNYHQFFLDNIQEGDKVLDVGCGRGELAFDLAKKASKVVAIDLDKDNLDKAKKKHQAPNITYILGDATTYNFQEHFSVAILSNVLEHLKERKEFLRKIKPLADKFLIRVPMLARDWIVLYKKEMGVEWRLDKGHFTEYTLETLKAELFDVGYNIENYSIQFGEIWAVVKP